MSKTIYKTTNYPLDHLIHDIDKGIIGLPEIQRPFVWKNAKVRDLFDSIYRGYPVGHLLFWQNSPRDNSKSIGINEEQKAPSVLIVDGQQRLTALFSVIKDKPVKRHNNERENIRIAFNPMEERFEVWDAAIERDRAFIPNISILWKKDLGLFKIVRDYIERLMATITPSEEQLRFIEDNITKLSQLPDCLFSTLELPADLEVAEVSEVFVRINSKGTPLKQADFILTLMSVFWDVGRSELEDFYGQSSTPSKDAPSPYNYFIEPKPEQLLRVSVGYAFKRARLRYVYSLLRGKDLDTEKFSDEKRIEQFKLLREAQKKVLNLQYWHDFLSCIKLAGFRSGKMISSQNNLLFSYILYLIGKTEYSIDEYQLRNIIAKWFFMSALTGRFTGSPETAMESDLARFRDVKDGDAFVNTLENICKIRLTDDYWGVTLPNDLATSSPRSPSLNAYMASLILLDAKALYSNLKISELLDPAIIVNRKLIERHHLFPTGYLESIKISSKRDTNQIANYAYVAWNDNLKISDQPPSEYTTTLKDRFSEYEIKQMYHWHALPEDWERLDYGTFLEKRRELMAKIIKEGYLALSKKTETRNGETDYDLRKLINLGESDAVEFKSTLRFNLHANKNDPRMEYSCLKTIAGFLNTNGGTLIIGIADDGSCVGISADKFLNEDKMGLHLFHLVKDKLGPITQTKIHIKFEDYDCDDESVRTMIVRCEKSDSPVYLKENNNEKFYIRAGSSTDELQVSQVPEYVKMHFE